MPIYIRNQNDTEFELIGETREDLIDNLNRTATPEYAGIVLTWYDVDHRKPLKINNSTRAGNVDLDTWEVTEGS